eukprot:6186347-Pleurochrysis_carterae.AAC.1
MCGSWQAVQDASVRKSARLIRIDGGDDHLDETARSQHGLDEQQLPDVRAEYRDRRGDVADTYQEGDERQHGACLEQVARRVQLLVRRLGC